MDSIAQKAAHVVEDNDVIFINDSLFNKKFIQYLDPDITLTIVTNSIFVAEQLIPLKNVHTFIRGGEIDANGNCIDIFTIDIIKRMRFDKSFITSSSISAEFGLSMQTNRSISLLNAIMESSKKSIGLYPSEKVGFESILNICPANKLDVLITNHDAPYGELVAFNEQGVKVIIAEEDMLS